jgi:hypothetical protein
MDNKLRDLVDAIMRQPAVELQRDRIGIPSELADAMCDVASVTGKMFDLSGIHDASFGAVLSAEEVGTYAEFEAMNCTIAETEAGEIREFMSYQMEHSC